MTNIAIQDGQVVLRDGAVGTEQACCCEPLPERCLCTRFSTCTTTIEYDGLVLAVQSSASASSFHQKVAGLHVYEHDTGFQLLAAQTSPIRELFFSGCGSRTSFSNDVLETNGLTVCPSAQSTTIDHHFFIAFAPHYLTGLTDYAATFLTKTFAYTYDLGVAKGGACPASITGRTVTVRKVAELNNGCNSNCSDWLDGFKDYLTNTLMGDPIVTNNTNSVEYDPVEWDDTSPSSTAQTDDSWICSNGLWSTPAEPVVSIACPP